MSLSLALGILVGDVGAFKLFTSAHAQEGGTCGGRADDVVIVSDEVTVADGNILSGMTVRNVTVNGNTLEKAVIVGSVQIIDATVQGRPSVIEPNGALVGSGSPCPNGALVGSGVATVSGALVGSGAPAPNGALVGSGVSVSGVTGYATGAASGGTLTGDDIVITDGFITGQNLLLSGATIDHGSVSGTITSVSVKPAD